jgi:hypothetical protein
MHVRLLPTLQGTYTIHTFSQKDALENIDGSNGTYSGLRSLVVSCAHVLSASPSIILWLCECLPNQEFSTSML